MTNPEPEINFTLDDEGNITGTINMDELTFEARTLAAQIVGTANAEVSILGDLIDNATANASLEYKKILLAWTLQYTSHALAVALNDIEEQTGNTNIRDRIVTHFLTAPLPSQRETTKPE